MRSPSVCHVQAQLFGAQLWLSYNEISSLDGAVPLLKLKKLWVVHVFWMSVACISRAKSFPWMKQVAWHTSPMFDCRYLANNHIKSWSELEKLVCMMLESSLILKINLFDTQCRASNVLNSWSDISISRQQKTLPALDDLVLFGNPIYEDYDDIRATRAQVPEG